MAGEYPHRRRRQAIEKAGKTVAQLLANLIAEMRFLEGRMSQNETE
jgi:hypothetical protein